MSWQGCSLSGDEQVIGHDRHKGELLTGSLTSLIHDGAVAGCWARALPLAV
jgi:hypothetical protein